MTAPTIIQLAAVLLTGLVAGLFYGYDCSVIKGLGNLPDKEYLGAFQSINRAILNPYFFLSFAGSLILLPVACWLSFRAGNTQAAYFLLAASLLYLTGVFLVTAAANVPLNDLLDRFNLLTGTPETISAFRKKFETGWNRWHQIRTFASVLTFLLSLLSIIKR